jgi:RHS repeat-associated protein
MEEGRARPSNECIEWDALNQLTAINQGTHRSEFTYDSDGRRVRMVEKENGATVEDKRFLWYGYGIAEERDAGGAATKRYFGGGVQQGGSNYLFTPDHLGSVREMTDTTGSARARYDLDPYGRRTKTSGDLDSDLGFTSTTAHSATGLSLAVFRTYDPERARWLNEDPAGLDGGLNLYGYVDGDPINRVDPLGLWSQWHQMAAAVLPGLWLWHPTALQSAPMGWLTSTASGWAGFGDTVSFGITNVIRDLTNHNDVVNKCGVGYKVGQVAGIIHSILLGGAGGWRAAGSAGPGMQFSHFIPGRALTWSSWASWLGRTRLNGNFVSQGVHAVSDPWAWRFLQFPLKRTATMLPVPIWTRLWMRLPNFPSGVAMGGLGGFAQHQANQSFNQKICQ